MASQHMNPKKLTNLQENANELRQALSYTTRSGRKVIKPSRYGE